MGMRTALPPPMILWNSGQQTLLRSPMSQERHLIDAQRGKVITTQACL